MNKISNTICTIIGFSAVIIMIVATFVAIYNSNHKSVKELIAEQRAEEVADSLAKVEKEKEYLADMDTIEIIKHQIDSIKAKYCKVITDKYTGRTFICSKNEPYYTNSRNYVGIYLSLDSNTYDSDGTLFLRADYVGSDWIFWERAYFLFDNEKKTDIGIKSYDKDTDVYSGGVSEVGDMSLGSLSWMDISDHNRLDLARMCMEAKTISVKLVGQYSKVISCRVNDFKPMCEIYFMIHRIRVIESKYNEE